jgi:hypothetical protein
VLDMEFIRSIGKQASGWLSDAALTRSVFRRGIRTPYSG